MGKKKVKQNNTTKIIQNENKKQNENENENENNLNNENENNLSFEKESFAVSFCKMLIEPGIHSLALKIFFGSSTFLIFVILFLTFKGIGNFHLYILLILTLILIILISWFISEVQKNK
eukprot:TRINITY_DN1974_c4_g1_i1.p1 TRINITY_DN1974_c4_g1~~TRINITY_DN1974_c4_g1_i1.p1  ORF type:complete len:119 (+),score=44.21 TRINITY_DN1974_c4_g1_i1:65-421(+)